MLKDTMKKMMMMMTVEVDDGKIQRKSFPDPVIRE